MKLMAGWGRRYVATLALAASFVTSVSCLARRRVITRQGGLPTQRLATADKATLIKQIAQRYVAVQSFSATVDMVPARGSTETGKVTEYKDVRAYILFRRPQHIRIIGLFPVVRNKAFDMASNGPVFHLYIPAKNRFIEGRNDVITPSANKLENLRPQHFLEALMVRPVESDHELSMLENFTDEENAAYILHVVEFNGPKQLILSRDIWFDRIALNIVRQMIFDTSGNILTDARYSNWQSYEGIPFPKHIEINRPQDEYAVVMSMVKLEMNKPLTDSQFALERPPGSELQVLGEKPVRAEQPKPAPPARPGRKSKK